MNTLAGLRTGGYCLGFVVGCKLIEERCGHLGTSGIVYAGKDYLEHVIS